MCDLFYTIQICRQYILQNTLTTADMIRSRQGRQCASPASCFLKNMTLTRTVRTHWLFLSPLSFPVMTGMIALQGSDLWRWQHRWQPQGSGAKRPPRWPCGWRHPPHARPPARCCSQWCPPGWPPPWSALGERDGKTRSKRWSGIRAALPHSSTMARKELAHVARSQTDRVRWHSIKHSVDGRSRCRGLAPTFFISYPWKLILEMLIADGVKHGKRLDLWTLSWESNPTFLMLFQ